MRVRALIASTLGILCLVVGCSHSNYTQYPVGWGDLVTAQNRKCIDIAGTYAYRNEIEKCSIGGMLSHITFDVAVTHVEIVQQHPDNLEIILWNHSVIVRRDQYKLNQEFSCTATEINLSPEREIFGSHTIGWNYRENKLMKTENGWLVVRMATGEYGLLGLLIPLAEKSTYWCALRQRDIRVSP